MPSHTCTIYELPIEKCDGTASHCYGQRLTTQIHSKQQNTVMCFCQESCLRLSTFRPPHW